MPRALSLRSRGILRDRITREPHHHGARLGVMLQTCNVPAVAVAILLELTPDTIYRWMYQDNVPPLHTERVKYVIKFLNRAARLGMTPLIGTVLERTNSFLALYAKYKSQGL